MTRHLSAPRTVVVTLACTAVLAAAPHGQGPTSRQDETPTFRAGVQYVEVDVTVVDGKGRPVRDLSRDDFTLLEDGVAQNVDSFRLVDIPLPPVERSREARSSVARDVMTNPGDGRVYVLLLDGSSGVNFLRTRSVARRFVDEALGANDLAAIVVANSTSAGGEGFTNDKARLRAAIDRFVSGPWGDIDEQLVSLNERSRATADAYSLIEVMATRLGAVGDRRKAIVWIGGAPKFFHRNVGETGEAFAQRDAIRAARANNIAIYPVDPYGLSPAFGNGELERQSGFRVVAEDTGGEAIVDTNNFSGNFRRIVEQNSTYYVLGYSPLTPTTDGSYHRITVRMKRPHLHVRAKTGYTSPRPRALPLSTGSGKVSEETESALLNMLPVSGLALQMTLTPFRNERGNASVLLSAELRGDDLRIDGDAQIEVAEFVIDPAGRAAGGRASMFTFDRREPHAPTTGVRYFDRLDLPPGRHEIRLVVHQSRGVTGSVIGNVDVPDFGRKGVTMSGLLIAPAAETPHRSLAGDRRAAAALGAEPTLTRQFRPEETLALWAQVYDTRPLPADSLVVNTEIQTADGKVVEAGMHVLPRAATCDRCFDYRDRVELSSLPQGDYVLRISARPAGQKQMVARAVPFTVLGN